MFSRLRRRELNSAHVVSPPLRCLIQQPIPVPSIISAVTRKKRFNTPRTLRTAAAGVSIGDLP